MPTGAHNPELGAQAPYAMLGESQVPEKGIHTSQHIDPPKLASRKVGT